MTGNQALAAVKQVMGYIGLALAIAALAKLAGVQVPIRGDVSQVAIVAAACLLAR